MHAAEDFRELARVARLEADAATDPVSAERLRELARNYERQAEELARGGPLKRTRNRPVTYRR